MILKCWYLKLLPQFKLLITSQVLLGFSLVCTNSIIRVDVKSCGYVVTVGSHMVLSLLRHQAFGINPQQH